MDSEDSGQAVRWTEKKSQIDETAINNVIDETAINNVGRMNSDFFTFSLESTSNVRWIYKQRHWKSECP